MTRAATTIERVAVLETKVDTLTEMQKQTLEIVTAVQVAQASVATDLARYRGAWGMILMIASAIGTVASIVVTWFRGGSQ